MIPAGRYRLASDGRMWKHNATQRMMLAEFLALHGNPDGSSTYPCIETMAEHLALSRRTISNLLADLMELGLLESEPAYSKYHGSRVRRMNIIRFMNRIGVEVREGGVQNSVVGVQDSKDEVQNPQVSRPKGVQNTEVGVHSNDAHDRTIPRVSQLPNRPLASDAVKFEGPNTIVGLNGNKPEPDDGFLFSKDCLEQKKATAKRILCDSGHDPELVHIAVERVADLASALEKTPVHPAYFVEGAKRALDDPDERREIEAILLRRIATGVASGEALASEERHPKAKILFVHKVVEEAGLTKRPACEILKETLTSGHMSTAENKRVDMKK
jgi:hypothetical protein